MPWVGLYVFTNIRHFAVILKCLLFAGTSCSSMIETGIKLSWCDCINQNDVVNYAEEEMDSEILDLQQVESVTQTPSSGFPCSESIEGSTSV